MTRRLSARPIARLVLVGVVTALISGFATSSVYALWRQEQAWQVPDIGTANVGLSAKFNGTDHAATAAQPQARFELGPQEAAALIANPEGTATAFLIQASSQGHLGLAYTIDLDVPEPGGVFASTTMAIYKVPNQGQCTLATAANHPLVSGEVTATGSTYAKYKSHEQWFCLVMEYDPGLAGSYSTTGEAIGSGPGGGDLSHSDQWEVDLVHDPDLEPPFGITAMPVITRAEESPVA